MTVTAPQRRAGVTLMEVLIATFILAIGLVAIMALFPIGAVNMARAINQDRSATHGVNSDAVFRLYHKQAWNDPTSGTTRSSAAEAYINSQEPMLFLLQNHVYYPTPNGPTAIPSTSSQPSFPVLVDPIGFMTNGSNGYNQFFVAGNPALPMRTTLRRCINYPNPPGTPGYSTAGFYPPGQGDPSFPAPFTAPLPAPPTQYPPIIPATIRLTTLLDDMTFARPNDGSNSAVNGEPADYTFQIDRGGRYNAAWLIQRPRTDVPAEVNVTVLVYAGRSPTDTPSAETAYPQAVAVQGQKNIAFPLGNQPPPSLRRGSWVGLSTVVPPPAQNVTWVPYPTLDFYRVTAMNTDTPGLVVLELDTPIKAMASVPQQFQGAVVVFDNLVEVFDRGTVSATGVTGP